MSDLATAARLRQATSQLPVVLVLRSRASSTPSSARLFARGPGYVGHELMVPERRRLPRARRARQRAGARAQPAGRRAAVRTSAATARRSCCKGRGNAPNIVCPLHRWTYDLQGRAARRAAFRRTALPEPGRVRRCSTGTACCSTARATSRATCAALGAERRSTSPATCSTASRCTSATTTGRPSSRSTSRTTTSTRSIRASASSSPATTCAGSSATGHRCRPSASTTASPSPARATYERWHDAVLDYYRGETPPHGAIWLTYYPNVMVEWYPHVLVVSTLIPQAVGQDAQRGRVLLPRGDRAVRARVRRGRAGRVPARPRRGRRDRRAHGRRPQRAVSRRAAAKSGPTSRRWKTACSTSTSSTGARWSRTLLPALDAHRRADADVIG